MRVKKFSWVSCTHENYFTLIFFYTQATYNVGDYHASFVTFKKQLLVLVCENEPWSVVKSGCKRNGGPTERSSTTHLLVDLARTSAGCDCVIRSPLLHAVGSLNALSQKASEKESVLPERLFIFILYALIIRCKIISCFFIFVVKAAHENILTTKISRSTVFMEQAVNVLLQVLFIFA